MNSENLNKCIDMYYKQQLTKTTTITYKNQFTYITHMISTYNYILIIITNLLYSII